MHIWHRRSDDERRKFRSNDHNGRSDLDDPTGDYHDLGGGYVNHSTVYRLGIRR